MRLIVRCGCLILFFVIGAVPSFGWGCSGHQIVALVAQYELTPKARNMVLTSLGELVLPSQSGADPIGNIHRFCLAANLGLMANVSTWPDDARSGLPTSGTWHFWDIPLGASLSSSAVQVPGCDEYCLVGAINAQLALLKSPKTDSLQRARALMFIIHLVGDLHEPLHVADNNDRGANCVPITFQGRRPIAFGSGTYSPNLHGFWDSDLVTERGGIHKDTYTDDLQNFVKRLRDKYSAQIKQWETAPLDLTAWAWQSHDVAVQIAYGKLPHRIKPEQPVPVQTCHDNNNVGQRMLSLSETVDQQYLEVAGTAAEEQLAKAGARLAVILNTAAEEMPSQGLSTEQKRPVPLQQNGETPGLWERVWNAVRAYVSAHVSQVVGYCLVAIILLTFSTRLILLLLQWEVPIVKDIASSFYLTSIGRWRLYRQYHKSIRTQPEMLALSRRFVELSYIWNGVVLQGELTSQLAASKSLHGLAIVADGGTGKTATCYHIAYLCSAGGLRIGGKPRVPVIVEGFAFSGNLVDAIENALTRYHAYVNSSIVKAQLEMGVLVVIFDGYSEIPQMVTANDKTRDIAAIVSKFPDSSFIFTSRTPLPVELKRAFATYSEVAVEPLSDTTERRFLEKYLNEKTKVDDVLEGISRVYQTVPRIPLLLKLIAASFNQKGNIPESRAALFADYAYELLRPEATGVKEPDGLHFAVEYLVRFTHIESNGDHGFVQDVAVDILIKVADKLGNKGYGLSLSAIDLLKLFGRAGLLRSSGSFWKFFHDSFESYYAGRVLANAFRSRDLSLIKTKMSAPLLKEAFQFLEELLDENERAKLAQLTVEAKNASQGQS